jgi:peptidoglycan hydrolase CwlO-like protein
VDAAAANVDEIARTAYQTGSGMRTFSVLLSASSSGSLVDQLTMLQQLSTHQQHEINAYSDAKKRYDAEKKRLDALLAAQNAQKADLATKKAKIEGDIARLDGMQKKVNASTGKANTGTTKYGPAPAVSGAAGRWWTSRGRSSTRSTSSGRPGRTPGTAPG